MAKDKFSSFLNKLIDNALDTFELITEETRRARIKGLQNELMNDLTSADLEDISIKPINFYQHLRHRNALKIGKNIFDNIATLKQLGKQPEEIYEFLFNNLPNFNEEKLASTLTSIKEAIM